MQVSDQCLGCARITSSKHFWLLFWMCAVVSSPRAPKDKALSLRWWISQCPLWGKGRKPFTALQLAATTWGWGRRCGNVFLSFPTSILTHFPYQRLFTTCQNPAKTCGLLRGTLRRQALRGHCWLCSASGGWGPLPLFLPCQPLQNKVLFCLVLWHLLIPPLTVLAHEIRFCFPICQNPGFLPDSRNKSVRTASIQSLLQVRLLTASCSGSSLSSPFSLLSSELLCSFFPTSPFTALRKFSPDQKHGILWKLHWQSSPTISSLYHTWKAASPYSI